jgi:hypothetical protein
MGFDFLSSKHDFRFQSWEWPPIAQMIEDSGIITSAHLHTNDGLYVNKYQALAIADYLETILMEDPNCDVFTLDTGGYKHLDGHYFSSEKEEKKAIEEGHAICECHVWRWRLEDFIYFCGSVVDGFTIY